VTMSRYCPRIPFEGLRNTAKFLRLHRVPVEIRMQVLPIVGAREGVKNEDTLQMSSR
jgi:hypothetical protein